MSIKSVTPYLILSGKAEQAIELYQRCLGARTETLQRFGDMAGSCPDALKSRVMHAELRVGNALLMMSDGPGEGGPADGGSGSGSGSVSIALDLDDPEEARRSFDGLAASGGVIQPLGAAPWGGLFGVVRDEFGIHWMFNCATNPA